MVSVARWTIPFLRYRWISASQNFSFQIFLRAHARRHYREMPDPKSVKRHQLAARLSWQAACDHGYRRTLAEWTHLLCDHARGPQP